MKKSTKQKARRKDGAKDVSASVAPWAMKYRVGDPYTHRKNNSDSDGIARLIIAAIFPKTALTINNNYYSENHEPGASFLSGEHYYET